MRVSSLCLIVFLSVLGVSLGYKLRRDINKIRQYCKEICTQCGGEAALSRDVCVCNIEEAEGEEVQNCLERARNKFDFLGIKLETDNRPVDKRSIYKSHHPDDRGNYLFTEPDQEKKTLFKRSSMMHGTKMGKRQLMDVKFRSKRSYNDYGSRFDITRLADMFQPSENYPIRPSNFKILLGSSKQPDMNRGLYYDMMSRQKNGDEDGGSDESDSGENGDRSNLGDAFNLRRLVNQQNKMYRYFQPVDMARADDSNFNEFNSIWDSILTDIINPNYYIPQNFADNVMFL